MVIRTDRLAMRQLDSDDADFIVELLNEPGFLRYIGDKGVRTSADACDYIAKGPGESYLRNGYGLYAVCLHDGTRTGICGLVKREGLDDPDVGFAFLSRYGSRGYAAESAAAVLRYGSAVLKLPRIVAITSPDNAASMAVLKKIGLRFERMIRLADEGLAVRLFGPGTSSENMYGAPGD